MALERIDVSQMVAQLVANVRPLLQRNSNILTTYCSDTLEPMLADGVDIREVLLSILRNATTYTRQGSITVDVEPCTIRGVAGVRFAITDTGAGMSEAQKAAAFSPTAAVVRRDGPTGLKLGCVSTLCDAMGGSLAVRSGPGEGSCFTVVLPAAGRNTAAERVA